MALVFSVLIGFVLARRNSKSGKWRGRPIQQNNSIQRSGVNRLPVGHATTPTPGATAATFTRTMRLELPTGARSISSRPQRQRDFLLLSASSIRRLIVLGEQLRATAASSMVRSSG